MYSSFVYAYVDLLGFWSETPAAKRFPGYYRGLRERWMRKSPCYFFLSHAQKVGSTVPPTSKSGGTRSLPPVPP